jgi:predicted XRE-type DNA-binding protein
MLYPLFNDPFNDLAFDKALWHQHRNDTSPDNPRGNMAHDLATLLETEQMTRAEVITLLGQPDARSSDTMLSYQLGMWSGFRIDNDTLDVFFDHADHVIDARVVQH